MTESERRRVQLLQKTRMLYSDKKSIPAVHPRYHSVYEELYGSEETDSCEKNSTMGVRICICILLFALYAAADYKDVNYAQVDSEWIVREIEREIPFW